MAWKSGGGTYAVKLLNPQIMARPVARGNYRRAEAMEALWRDQLAAAALVRLVEQMR